MNKKLVVLGLGVVVLAFALAACGGGGTPTPTAVPDPTFTPTPTLVPPTQTPEPTSTPTSEPPTATAAPPSASTLTTPQIIKALSPSVVHIQTEAVQLDQFNRPVPGVGVGTGKIFDERGHILTNNHVIAGAERIVVTLSDGRTFEADLVGGDSFLDIAVLRINAEDIVPIPIGKSSDLQVGDHVITIGHALNLPGGPTITGGWVSALERAIDFSAQITMQHLIQTDAAINPGNSGGPLVNTDGQMVGINTAKLDSGEGIGFAIAIEPVMPLINELILNGKIDRGFFGASVVNITEAVAINFDLPVTSGAGVISVAPGSPAEQVGLREQDIIVALAGQPVGNVAELDSILIQYRAGFSVEVVFYRGNDKRTVTVTLAERPA